MAAIKSFLQGHDVTYRNLIERQDSLHRAYRAQSLPTTVLVGRDGNVLDYGIGLRGSKRLMDRAEELVD